MSIKQINPEDIPGRKCNHNNNIQKEIELFIKSDWPACEIDATHYANATICRNTYRTATKRIHVNVTIIRRGGRVFMLWGET